MSSCPRNEALVGVLADTLAAEERDRVARHVEGCAPCQEKLARLTGAPDTELWRRAEQLPQDSEAEEGAVRRLKRVPPSSAAPRPEQADPTPLGIDSDLPAVPGFEVLGELGRGGMGVVYKARQVALQRTVALKMVLNGAHSDPKELARFRAEAAAIARLQHPNIVQIYDVGEAAGRPYFALEFVAGGSLAQHPRGTTHPARPAAGLIETLARAVHAAHASGVVHRDLKPANILLSCSRDAVAERGAGLLPALRCEDSASRLNGYTPKIADFGV